MPAFFQVTIAPKDEETKAHPRYVSAWSDNATQHAHLEGQLSDTALCLITLGLLALGVAEGKFLMCDACTVSSLGLHENLPPGQQHSGSCHSHHAFESPCSTPALKRTKNKNVLMIGVDVSGSDLSTAKKLVKTCVDTYKLSPCGPSLLL